MPSRDLAGWLEFIERLHPQAIALGLDRVRAVLDRMGVALDVPVITVGGTNGKGSTCALLDAMLRAGGHRVGLYSSPHLVRYNERVRIAGRESDDAALIAGFERVDAARGDIALTYFEFGTLAAWAVFAEQQVEALVLEIGMGGRLDAVNLFEPDCAVVTSIDLDHMEHLGATREAIGLEKAHIFRPGKPAICGAFDPPITLVEHARTVGAKLQLIGRDFGYEAAPGQWRYWGPAGTRRAGLAHPALRGRVQLGNAATAIAALDSLHARLPVSTGAIRAGLADAALPARFQVMPGRPTVVLDVAHNPEAARVLAENLAGMGRFRRTIAVAAMLRDKDMVGVGRVLSGAIDEWLVAGLPGSRGCGPGAFATALAEAGIQQPVICYDDVAHALAAAKERATSDDRIVVFGSFLTIAAVLAPDGPSDR